MGPLADSRPDSEWAGRVHCRAIDLRTRTCQWPRASGPSATLCRGCRLRPASLIAVDQLEPARGPTIVMIPRRRARQPAGNLKFGIRAAHQPAATRRMFMRTNTHTPLCAHAEHLSAVPVTRWLGGPRLMSLREGTFQVHSSCGVMPLTQRVPSDTGSGATSSPTGIVRLVTLIAWQVAPSASDKVHWHEPAHGTGIMIKWPEAHTMVAGTIISACHGHGLRLTQWQPPRSELM